MDLDEPGHSAVGTVVDFDRMAELRRLRLLRPLPCGVGGCGAPARVGLAEPDPELPGVWIVLPLCDECRRKRLGSGGVSRRQ